jgi:hypothetical protein
MDQHGRQRQHHKIGKDGAGHRLAGKPVHRGYEIAVAGVDDERLTATSHHVGLHHPAVQQRIPRLHLEREPVISARQRPDIAN